MAIFLIDEGSTQPAPEIRGSLAPDQENERSYVRPVEEITGEQGSVPQGGKFKAECEPCTATDPAHPQEQTPRRSPFNRIFVHDVAMTLVAEASTVLSSLIVTSLISRWLGARSLSEYLLLRRVLVWLLSGTLLGFSTGLPRYVAKAAGQLHSTGNRDQDEPAYFLSALMCLFPAAFVMGVFMAFFRRSFAKLLFGNQQETGLVLALAMLLVGFAIHRAAHGYYRGLLDMTRTNLLEICNVALLPLVVVLVFFRSQPIGAMMFATGGLMTIVGVLWAVPIFRRLRQRPAGGTLRTRSAELLRYGLPRVPGDFGAAALMALGPVLAAQFMDLAQVSPLLLGLNILMVTGYAAAPLGMVLLSKVSMMLGQNQHDEVQVRLRLLVVAVIEVSVFTCVQLAIFTDVVVRAWVGPGFENQMGVMRLVLLAIPPYLFYVALRSTIDAATVKPFNAANVLITLTVYLGLVAACIAWFPQSSMLMGIAGSLLGSQILLSFLTARTFRRFYGLGVPWRSLGPSFAATLVLGAAAFGLRKFWSDPIPLWVAVLSIFASTSLYLALLAKRGSGWVAYTWNVGVRRRVNWSFKTAQS